MESSWKRENGRLSISAEIPAGATGTIIVPLAPDTAEVLDEATGLPVAAGRAGVRATRLENRRMIITVGSGHYDFSTPEE